MRETNDKTRPAAVHGLPPLWKDRVFLVLAAVAVAALLLVAYQAWAGEVVTVHGLVLDSEMGAVLEADNGDVYILEGPDMTAYFDTLATVSGELSRDEGGNLYLDVTAVAPDLDTPSGDVPATTQGDSFNPGAGLS